MKRRSGCCFAHREFDYCSTRHHVLTALIHRSGANLDDVIASIVDVLLNDLSSQANDIGKVHMSAILAVHMLELTRIAHLVREMLDSAWAFLMSMAWRCGTRMVQEDAVRDAERLAALRDEQRTICTQSLAGVRSATST